MSLIFNILAIILFVTIHFCIQKEGATSKRVNKNPYDDTTTFYSKVKRIFLISQNLCGKKLGAFNELHITL